MLCPKIPSILNKSVRSHLLTQSANNSRGLNGRKTEARGKHKYLKLHFSSGFQNNSEGNIQKRKNPKTSKLSSDDEKMKDRSDMHADVKKKCEFERVCTFILPADAAHFPFLGLLCCISLRIRHYSGKNPVKALGL